MKYAYAAICTLEEGTKETYNVHFPDLPGCVTFGESIADAVAMAKDALCLWLYDKELDGKPIPDPTLPSKFNTDGEDFVSVVSVDTEDYRRYYSDKLVKKTVNIPAWLNSRGEEARINFSQTLQRALMDELKIPQ